jgi:hypothetical protein
MFHSISGCSLRLTKIFFFFIISIKSRDDSNLSCHFSAFFLPFSAFFLPFFYAFSSDFHLIKTNTEKTIATKIPYLKFSILVIQNYFKIILNTSFIFIINITCSSKLIKLYIIRQCSSSKHEKLHFIFHRLLVKIKHRQLCEE